jgi:hypothetical protein
VEIEIKVAMRVTLLKRDMLESASKGDCVYYVEEACGCELPLLQWEQKVSEVFNLCLVGSQEIRCCCRIPTR